VLIETWKSQAALDAPMETPHLKQMFAVLERVTRNGAIIHRLEELT
jgi:quinol monooxygenase YgiN